jgi:hypothetical protein
VSFPQYDKWSVLRTFPPLTRPLHSGPPLPTTFPWSDRNVPGGTDSIFALRESGNDRDPRHQAHSGGAAGGDAMFSRAINRARWKTRLAGSSPAGAETGVDGSDTGRNSRHEWHNARNRDLPAIWSDHPRRALKRAQPRIGDDARRRPDGDPTEGRRWADGGPTGSLVTHCSEHGAQGTALSGPFGRHCRQVEALPGKAGEARLRWAKAPRLARADRTRTQPETRAWRCVVFHPTGRGGPGDDQHGGP